jgi:hypothetical protein
LATIILMGCLFHFLKSSCAHNVLVDGAFDGADGDVDRAGLVISPARGSSMSAGIT